MATNDSIYLDHNATTPLLPEVAEAMDRTQRAGYANPASQHAPGRRSRRVVEEARERIAELLGADLALGADDRLIFTSGGTEANNLALRGLVGAMRSQSVDAAAASPSFPIPHSPFPVHLLVSAVEHPSILGAAGQLVREGCEVEPIPVDRDGRVDVASLDAMLRPTTRLVSVMLGNNETGVIQPIAESAAVCRARGILFHTDAVQAVGKIEVGFRALGVDALSFTAHKFHGPAGIGGLLVRGGVPLRPLLFGGFQQHALRPGTESPALVVGLLTALEAWHRERAERTRRLAALRDDLERRLTQAAPELVIHGRDVARLPQTSNVAFIGVDRQAMMMALDGAGIACSTGSACASGSSEPSPTLIAMRRSEAEIAGALRFSVGLGTTAAEVADAAERILRVYNDLRRLAERRKKGVAGRSADRKTI